MRTLLCVRQPTGIGAAHDRQTGILCNSTRSTLDPSFMTGQGGPLMLRYKPDKFASLSESDIGQRLWSFLTRAETIARLETASELGKPAVEGI